MKGNQEKKTHPIYIRCVFLEPSNIGVGPYADMGRFEKNGMNYEVKRSRFKKLKQQGGW